MMKKIISIWAVGAMLVFLAFAPFTARGQGEDLWKGTSCYETGDPCSFCDGVRVAVNIINFIVKIAIVIAAGLIVYGGAMVMISAGNSGRFGNGKKIITTAIWGLAITFMAWIIVDTVLKFLAQDTADISFTNWSSIKCTSY